eukprot:gnl/Spiro4/9682_TR5142_c0_g1_i1.p1 gnl/Spiro4/9682_TR5142_c0_g1~~gnl/Spiro4/9682_TR5142_c0_g1_i1.p1  ORF type:complete len:213 (+),score=33.21 gnl/Spiro4/9682_TR5142_c0_g1_i1:31-639(+)
MGLFLRVLGRYGGKELMKAMPQQTHVIDVKGKTLGRVAVDIARILQGKNKICWDNSADWGDRVVVINAKYVRTTGRKEHDKIYWKYTGFVGHLKEKPLWWMLEHRPQEVILRAVKNMLPRNNLRKFRLRKLRVFSEWEHSAPKNAIVRQSTGSEPNYVMAHNRHHACFSTGNSSNVPHTRLDIVPGVPLYANRPPLPRHAAS